MKRILYSFILVLLCHLAVGQQLLLLDRFNGNKVVNDSTITAFSSEVGIPELMQ